MDFTQAEILAEDCGYIDILEESAPEELLKKKIGALIISTEKCLEKIRTKAAMKAIRSGGQAEISREKVGRIEKLEFELGNLRTLLKRVKSKKEMDISELARTVTELKRTRKQIKLAKATFGGTVARTFGLIGLLTLLSGVISAMYVAEVNARGLSGMSSEKMKNVLKWSLSKEGMKRMSKGDIPGAYTHDRAEKILGYGAAAGTAAALFKGGAEEKKRRNSLKYREKIKEDVMYEEELLEEGVKEFFYKKIAPALAGVVLTTGALAGTGAVEDHIKASRRAAPQQVEQRIHLNSVRPSENGRIWAFTTDQKKRLEYYDHPSKLYVWENGERVPAPLPLPVREELRRAIKQTEKDVRWDPRVPLTPRGKKQAEYRKKLELARRKTEDFRDAQAAAELKAREAKDTAPSNFKSSSYYHVLKAKKDSDAIMNFKNRSEVARKAVQSLKEDFDMELLEDIKSQQKLAEKIGKLKFRTQKFIDAYNKIAQKLEAKAKTGGKKYKDLKARIDKLGFEMESLNRLAKRLSVKRELDEADLKVLKAKVKYVNRQLRATMEYGSLKALAPFGIWGLLNIAAEIVLWLYGEKVTIPTATKGMVIDQMSGSLSQGEGLKMANEAILKYKYLYDIKQIGAYGSLALANVSKRQIMKADKEKALKTRQVVESAEEKVFDY